MSPVQKPVLDRRYKVQLERSKQERSTMLFGEKENYQPYLMNANVCLNFAYNPRIKPFVLQHNSLCLEAEAKYPKWSNAGRFLIL